MEWSDSASYEGMWVLGYACGKGVFTDCLGNRYIGDFWLSMAHGRGIYTNTLGAVYDGEWKFDMQQGQGIERWLNSGSYFEGNFEEGLRNGYGIWSHKGKRYEGEWRKNMMEGEGIMEWGYLDTPTDSGPTEPESGLYSSQKLSIYLNSKSDRSRIK